MPPINHTGHAHQRFNSPSPHSNNRSAYENPVSLRLSSSVTLPPSTNKQTRKANAQSAHRAPRRTMKHTTLSMLLVPLVLLLAQIVPAQENGQSVKACSRSTDYGKVSYCSRFLVCVPQRGNGARCAFDDMYLSR
eukprot:IDg16506t1